MSALPKRMNQTDAMAQERVYRTGLNCRDYLRLELEASERGIKPYGLAQSIITLYLNEQLIILDELPSFLQEQIKHHLKKETAKRPIKL